MRTVLLAASVTALFAHIPADVVLAANESCAPSPVIMTDVGVAGTNPFRNSAGNWTMAVIHNSNPCFTNFGPAIFSNTPFPPSCKQGAKVTTTFNIEVGQVEFTTQRNDLKSTCQ